MAPSVYMHSDGGAPTLNGVAGTLISVLDYALVSGLGWTKGSVSTNVATYRAPAGVRHYLYVDDNAPSAVPRCARLAAYTDYATLANSFFPGASAAYTAKSSTADTVARPWLIIGDDRTFYYFGGVTQSTSVSAALRTWPTNWMFGEFYSFLSGDTYRSMLMYPLTAAGFTDARGINMGTTGGSGNAINGNCPSSYLGLGGGIWITPIGNPWFSFIGGLSPLPNPVDGGIYCNKLLVNEKGNASQTVSSNPYPIRGRMRGLYQQIHDLSGTADGDTFSGSGDYAGKTFKLVRGNTTSNGFAIETTAWETSS